MSTDSAGQITRLVQEYGDGNESALDELMPLVYDELHAIAHRRMVRESDRHSLQTTGLVHEAYMKLYGQNGLSAKNRNHFYAIVARIMKTFLIDYARGRNAQKRGGDQPKLYLTQVGEAFVGSGLDMLELSDAIERLSQEHERAARVVEMRFFIGLNHREVADVLEISETTARSDWALARAWLFDAMKSGD